MKKITKVLKSCTAILLCCTVIFSTRVIEESTGNVDNSTAYAGYLYDAETSLYYLNARMYNPETARFMQEDTYNGSISDPLSLNLYTYCHNEPNMHYDPSGHIAIPASIRDGTASIVDALAWVLKVLESLKSLTKEEFADGMKKAAEGTERFQEAWKDFRDWLNEYKEETAWVLGSAALIAGGIIAMPAHPIIGAGLLGAGISTIAKGVGELSNSGSITGSLGSYARSAAGGFVGGSIMGATGWAVQAAGVTGIAASTAMGLGGIASSMADQHISTGEVDMGQAIVSGALSFGLSEAGRGMSHLANNSTVRNFFRSEQGGTISFPGGKAIFPAGGRNPNALGGWNNWRNFAANEVGSIGRGRGGSGSVKNLISKSDNAKKWGVLDDGTNQGAKHFVDYWEKYPERIPSLEQRLGMPRGSFSNSLEGFNNFTTRAERVISDATANGMVRNINGKSIYYVDGAANAKKGVVVIVRDGKIQSMMPSDINSFNKLQ